jgi:hypothetical protein
MRSTLRILFVALAGLILLGSCGNLLGNRPANASGTLVTIQVPVGLQRAVAPGFTEDPMVASVTVTVRNAVTFMETTIPISKTGDTWQGSFTVLKKDYGYLTFTAKAFDSEGLILYSGMSGIYVPDSTLVLIPMGPHLVDPASKADMDAALALLTNSTGFPDIDGARALVMSAVQKDPTNAEAVMWLTVFNLAALSVDPVMANFMATYVGFQDYPANLNQLFISQDWMKMELVEYDWWTDEPYPIYMPTITIDQRVKDYFAGTLDANTRTEWLNGLIVQIVTRNPQGFNSMTDTLGGILDSGLTAAINMLSSIPANTRITIPSTLFGEPEMPDQEIPDIVIGKAELLLETALFQNIKAFLHMGRAVSLSLPLQDYFDALNPFDNPELYPANQPPDFDEMIARLSGLDSPFAAGFLLPREDAAQALDLAKTETLAALGNMSTAFDSMRLRVPEQGFTFGPGSFLFEGELAPDWNSQILAILGFSRNLVNRTAEAIANDSILYFPVPNPDGYLDEWQYLATHAGDDYWPIASDLGDPVDWPSGINLPMVIALRPSAAFETPLFALSSLMDMNLATGEPHFYEVFMGEEYAITGIADEPVTLSSVNSEGFYALKFDLSLNRSLVFTSDEYAEILDLMVMMFVDGMLPPGFDPSQLLVWSEDDGVSLYLPLVTGPVVQDSLTETKSFWWSMATLLKDMFVRIIPPTITLSLDQWTIGELTYDQPEIWYEVVVMPGQTYEISWDDSLEGNEIYSGDIIVTAYRQDRSTMYYGYGWDFGYYEPVVVTIPYDDSRLYLRVTYKSYGSFAIKVSESGELLGPEPDMYEDYSGDNSYSVATYIEPGMVTFHSLTYGDEDWFTFWGVAGTTYYIMTSGDLESSLDNQMHLYDFSLGLVDYNDDYYGYYAGLEFTALEDSYYYVKVSGLYEGTVGYYTMSLTTDGGSGPY